ncbi:hypothetical protein [Luteibacter sp. ME-Dv--P-043b]|uniref:hypothetical protein n=1 Tax=Luteibacter sp. ME-Dv--P-043b TaxID=3040291 RepID=UPI0025542DAD|nr:hypothetical protein [Luteibacter sp. ME-Dv--P-043b]
MRMHCFIAVLAILPGAVAASQVAGTDVLAQWQHHRIERLGGGQASLSRQDIVAQLLVQPSSAYSATVDQPAFTNEIDWPATLASTGLDGGAALAALRRDLGVTRARPRLDVTPAPGFRDDFIAASATKAGVDADIFWHMLDLTGYRHSTKAAIYAVGLQILRAQMTTTPHEQWTPGGIDPAVFTRVMRAQHGNQLTAYDLDYLSTLVQYRLIHRRVSEAVGQGRRSLPAAYRVARVAAAYRDAKGYVGAPPCTRDAAPHVPVAGTGDDDDERPLCFVAATDRAVHAWYIAEYQRQARAAPPPHRDTGLHRLAVAAGLVLALVDLAGAVEFIEASVADDLATAEAIGPTEANAASEPANLLSCPL